MESFFVVLPLWGSYKQATFLNQSFVIIKFIHESFNSLLPLTPPLPPPPPPPLTSINQCYAAEQKRLGDHPTIKAMS